MSQPEWTLRSSSWVVWSEDDATLADPDHEGLSRVLRSLYPTGLSRLVETYDVGDAVFYRYADGRVVSSSHPGGSEVRELIDPNI